MFDAGDVVGQCVDEVEQRVLQVPRVELWRLHEHLKGLCNALVDLQYTDERVDEVESVDSGPGQAAAHQIGVVTL